VSLRWKVLEGVGSTKEDGICISSNEVGVRHPICCGECANRSVLAAHHDVAQTGARTAKPTGLWVFALISLHPAARPVELLGKRLGRCRLWGTSPTTALHG